MLPNSPQRIYITGAGIVSPLGLGWRENEEALAEGRTAFRPVTLFDVSERIAKTAASVDVPEEWLFTKLPRRRQHLVDRSTKMMLVAVREALAMAGLKGLEGIDAMVLGTSAGAMMIGQEYFRHARGSQGRVAGQLSRLEFYQPQRQLRAIADEFGWRGPIMLVTNACASGANAIGDAMMMIRAGRYRRVLAGGFDGLAELVFSGFDSLRALAPSGIPRPFDADRDGLALGEGAGVVILEGASAAAERGAEAVGEVAGYGVATDLHHLTQPDPEGKAALRAMAGACAMAGVRAEQVEYINSHGTGTPYNDGAEAAAIRSWAGSATGGIAVSSTKAAMGHLLGGAGAVETVISLMALVGKWVPASLNVRKVDEMVKFDLVREFRPAPLNAVITNSFGFGGSNASLLLTEAGFAPVPAGPVARNGANGRMVVRGAGAVSPAGWGCEALAGAVCGGAKLATTDTQRPGSNRREGWHCTSLQVPAPEAERLPKFPRLRRSSAITKFAMGAALEALEQAGLPRGEGAGRLGIILGVFNGCVQFSGKFYREVLDTPALASPLMFPETVYNAPASHVAAFLGVDGPVSTLVGESNVFMEALAMAQTWLSYGWADHCLVIGAEECDWLGAEAATYYHKELRAGEGAGALLLAADGEGVRLLGIGPGSFGTGGERVAELCVLARAVQAAEPAATLIDHRAGIHALDREEEAAWTGVVYARRLHPRQLLGESMGAAAALQLALAVTLARQKGEPVHVSLPGAIGSAYGAVVTPS